jgi:DNA polymerase-4/DNA polymerase V
MSLNTYTVHIDGDAFFVSCELSRFPHLKDKPVVVGRERGIAVAYNSHAKVLGITRAMPIHQIQRQFPQVVILTSHFELYKTFSRRMASIVSKYVDSLEVYSIDEVFCTYTEKVDVISELQIVQKEISDKLGITVSIGIAKTKVLAKMATSVQKPEGVTLIDETNRLKILKNIPIGQVWGIGRRTADKWQQRGIQTVYDFISIPQNKIIHEHAPVQELYYELSGRSVMNTIGSKKNKDQQSFQSTESFPKTNERAFLFSEISRHVEILGMRILKHGLYTKHIHVYLKDSHGYYHEKNISLSTNTQDTGLLINSIETIFDQIYTETSFYKSAGVTLDCLNRLETWTPQAGLFEDLETQTQTRVSTSLESLKASIRAKNGYSSIYSGSSSISVHRKADKRTRLNQTDPYIYGLPLPYLGECL